MFNSGYHNILKYLHSNASGHVPYINFLVFFFKRLYTVQKEEPVRLILLMQRENILYMTDTTDVASFLADFYVLYKFASVEYVECAGILITLLITTYFTLHERNQTYTLLFLDSVREAVFKSK
jgi:hypothetical protein